MPDCATGQRVECTRVKTGGVTIPRDWGQTKRPICQGEVAIVSIWLLSGRDIGAEKQRRLAGWANNDLTTWEHMRLFARREAHRRRQGGQIEQTNLLSEHWAMLKPLTQKVHCAVNNQLLKTSRKLKVALSWEANVFCLSAVGSVQMLHLFCCSQTLAYFYCKSKRMLQLMFNSNS